MHAVFLLSGFELFERLAFGAVLPLFALYLHEQLGYSEDYAIALSSGFLAGSYLASIPGGFLADRFLGSVAAVAIGTILIAAGLLGLATPRAAAFWPALGFLMLGQGLVKPDITNMIGGFYSTHDGRRESGFSIFYIAVNLGALAGPLLAEWARARWGWRTIFVCAAAAMLPALLLLIPVGRLMIKKASIDGRAYVTLSPHAVRARMQALLLLCGVAVLFWLAFQQTGASLALFAENQTIQRVTALGGSILLRPGHFAALHAALVIGFTPLLLWIMDRLLSSALPW